MRSPLVRAVPLLVFTAALASADPRTAGHDVPARETPAAPDGAYLVITDAPMLGAFQRFVAWKKRQGVDAHLLEMKAIRRRYPAARDEAERVRLAIQDAHAAGVRWVLLGGDTEVVPTRMLRTEALGFVRDFACDLYFADLQGDWDADGDGIWGEGLSPEGPGDGTDLVADVHLGRAPVRNAREAMAFVEKTIRHAERTRQRRVVIAAEVLGSFLDLAELAELTLMGPLEDVPGLTVERLYETFDDPRWRPGATALTEPAFLQALASGPELVIPSLGGGPVAMGMGGATLLAPEDLAALEGTNPAGVMWATLPSETHAIDRDAIGEAWVRVRDGGVVASIGTSYLNLVGLGHSTMTHSVRALAADGGGRVGALLDRHRGFLGDAAQHEGTFHRASALSLLLLGDPQVEIELGAPSLAALPASATAPRPEHADDPALAIATVPRAPAVATPAHGLSEAGAVMRASPSPAREFCELQLGRGVAGRGILVYDVAGRIVRRVEADARGVARWDLADRTGRRVRAGVYFARPASDLAAPVTRIVVAR